jgi:hypothetical protein
VLPGHTRTPSQILGELLAGHPEAASLQAEASHCQALARSSAANVGQEFIATQAARLSYEELRHRLDPRRHRTIHFGAGLILLTVLGAGLTMLDVIELSGLLGGLGSVLPALAATAVWLTGAWLAALASRERRWTLVLATIGGAILLGLLLATLHGFEPRPDWPAVSEHVRGSWLFGVLVGVFILVLVVGAAVLMAHMECASLFLARRRWHRARAAHEAAVQTEQEDVEAASVAVEAWLGLVRTRASTAAGDGEHLVHETVVLAVALLESGRPQLPPPGRTG